MLLFMSMTGTNITHVPYKGSAPMGTDLLGGHIDVAFDNAPNVLPHIKANALRALGATSVERSAFAPDIPTVAEAGVPGYEVAVWFGVVAPAGVPQDVLTKLNTEINRILAMPDVKKLFLDQGVEPVGGTREKFGEHIKTQMDKWAKVVKEAGVKAE
jgi:tripartite-type tricarboxylate transporter receptor subunit TctC